MKQRLVLVFLAFNIASGCSQVPSSISTINETPVTLVQQESEDLKKTKTAFEEVFQELENLDSSFYRVVLFLVKVIIILLSFIVIQRLLLLTVFRKSQLIIDNFTNASGAEGLDYVLTGLSQLGRERLIREMEGVNLRLKEHIVDSGLNAPRDRSPLPQTTPDDRLSNLVASLNEFTPDQIDPLIGLLKILFPPDGTKVTGTLQSKGQNYQKLGITFEITDIQGHVASKLYTIWEEREEILTKTDINTLTTISSEMETDEEIELPNFEAYPELKDRYHSLLKPTTRWLALQLSRKEMLASVPWYYVANWCKLYQSKIYNFFGQLNYASGQTHGKFFYKLAIEDYQKAIEFDPNWYQPYENLGDTYSTQERESKKSTRVNRLRQAIFQYEEALKRCEDETVIRRIKVGKARALLLTEDEIQVREAIKEIQIIEKMWNGESELDSRFLYNLASWYAILTAHNDCDEQTKLKARRYLIYALVRDGDRNLWRWSVKDPDFQPVRERFTDLQYVLVKKLNEVPEFLEITGERFVKHVGEVLKEMNWI